MYKCLMNYIVTMLIGLKPSNLFDAKKTKHKYQISTRTLNDEGGVITGHTKAFNGVHEKTSHGALHMYLMIWAAIGPALLQ